MTINDVLKIIESMAQELTSEPKQPFLKYDHHTLTELKRRVELLNES